MTVPKSRIFIDRFSAGLDDLTRKEQADDETVLDVLRATGRFSCFEAGDNMTIATTIGRLMKSDRLVTSDAGYPWTKVQAIDGELIDVRPTPKQQDPSAKHDNRRKPPSHHSTDSTGE